MRQLGFHVPMLGFVMLELACHVGSRELEPSCNEFVHSLSRYLVIF